MSSQTIRNVLTKMSKKSLCAKGLLRLASCMKGVDNRYLHRDRPVLSRSSPCSDHLELQEATVDNLFEAMEDVFAASRVLTLVHSGHSSELSDDDLSVHC